MNSAKRKGSYDIVIYVLTKINLLAFRNIILLEPSFHVQGQGLQTQVAADCHASFYPAGDIHAGSSVPDVVIDFHVGVKNVGIPETLKELLVSNGAECFRTSADTVQVYYKGLQS